MSDHLHAFGHAWSEAPEVEYERRERQRQMASQHTPDVAWGENLRPRRARRLNRFIALLGMGWLAKGASA